MSLFDRIGKAFGMGREEGESAGVSAEPDQPSDVQGPGSDLVIEIPEPAPDAKVCQITLNRKVSPVGTVLFENSQDAEGWPMIQALFKIVGVHSVIAKESNIIVSKKAEAEWKSLLPVVRDVLSQHAGHAPGLESGEPVRSGSPAGAGADGTGETVWIRDGSEVAAHSNPVLSDGAGEAEDAKVPAEVTAQIKTDVEELLKKEINPYVATHGGVIELLDVRGTRIFIHMGGGCQGCGQATATLKNGVETAIRQKIPQVTEILDTTDHAAGTNPYFSATGF